MSMLDPVGWVHEGDEWHYYYACQVIVTKSEREVNQAVQEKGGYLRSGLDYLERQVLRDFLPAGKLYPY